MGELLQRKMKYGEDPLETKKKKKKGNEQHGDGKVLFHQSDLSSKPERLKNVLGEQTFKSTEVLAERKRRWVGEKG